MPCSLLHHPDHRQRQGQALLGRRWGRAEHLFSLGLRSALDFLERCLTRTSLRWCVPRDDHPLGSRHASGNLRDAGELSHGVRHVHCHAREPAVQRHPWAAAAVIIYGGDPLRVPLHEDAGPNGVITIPRDRPAAATA